MHPLDRPIWNALTGPQAHFAETAGSARRFPPAVTALGALEEPNEKAYAFLASLQKPREITALFLDDPASLPAGWKLVKTLPLLQMVHQQGNGITHLPQHSSRRWIELGA